MVHWIGSFPLNLRLERWGHWDSRSKNGMANRNELIFVCISPSGPSYLLTTEPYHTGCKRKSLLCEKYGQLLRQRIFEFGGWEEVVESQLVKVIVANKR